MKCQCRWYSAVRCLFMLMTMVVPCLLCPERASAFDSDKTARSFVQLLEIHDYWHRASTLGSDAKPVPDLADLARLNPDLSHLISYDRIHMDYGYRRKQRDPMHHFTILELTFRERADIPLADTTDVQRFPECDGLNGNERALVFPLWRYRNLVHHSVRWEHREYIRWYAIRHGRKVFVLYTIPVKWMPEIDKHAQMLYDYLTSATEEEMVDFVRGLTDSKASAPVAYDTVEHLQKTLARLGFDPGTADGYFGSKSEGALAALLTTLGYPVANEPNLQGIRTALRAFQGQAGLPATGRCEAETIRALEEAYGRRFGVDPQ